MRQVFATNAVAERQSSDVNFAGTSNSDYPWWTVDLEAEFDISELIIETGKSMDVTGSQMNSLTMFEKMYNTSAPRKGFLKQGK